MGNWIQLDNGALLNLDLIESIGYGNIERTQVVANAPDYQGDNKRDQYLIHEDEDHVGAQLYYESLLADLIPEGT